MSLTSYRAAPPRVSRVTSIRGGSGRAMRREGIAGLAADLLFHTLRCSTIGAEGFHGRVRDGIGCLAPRYGHQAGQAPLEIRGPRVSGGDVAGMKCLYARPLGARDQGQVLALGAGDDVVRRNLVPPRRF